MCALRMRNLISAPNFLTEKEFPLMSTQKQGNNIIMLGVFKKVGPQIKTGKLDEN